LRDGVPNQCFAVRVMKDFPQISCKKEPTGSVRCGSSSVLTLASRAKGSLRHQSERIFSFSGAIPPATSDARKRRIFHSRTGKKGYFRGAGPEKKTASRGRYRRPRSHGTGDTGGIFSCRPARPRLRFPGANWCRIAPFALGGRVLFHQKVLVGGRKKGKKSRLQFLFTAKQTVWPTLEPVLILDFGALKRGSPSQGASGSDVGNLFRRRGDPTFRDAGNCGGETG